MYMTCVSFGSITIALTARDGYPVSTRVQAAAPSPATVDFQSPPLAEPAQSTFGFDGSTATESTRPPTLSGPIDRHWGIASLVPAGTRFSRE